MTQALPSLSSLTGKLCQVPARPFERVDKGKINARQRLLTGRYNSVCREEVEVPFP